MSFLEPAPRPGPPRPSVGDPCPEAPKRSDGAAEAFKGETADGLDLDAPPIMVRGLVSRFGDHVIHDHLDLTVPRGQVVGVVGGSGAGKSVLLNTIIGLREPQAGSVKVFGQDIRYARRRQWTAIERRWGVLFQAGALWSNLTVKENVAAPLFEHTQMRPDEAGALADLKIALVGLPPGAGSLKPSELSGGMIKRASLARALALDPELLFLDEPTSGLDPISAAAFDELIHDLSDSLRLTVFMITHDLDSLYTITDQVAVLADKKVVAMAPVRELEKSDHPWIKRYFQRRPGPRGGRDRPRGEGGGLMERNANYALVGLISTVLVAGLIVFVVWLAGSGLNKQFDTYDIVFQGPVRGLSTGAEVHFNGIKVGEVSKISLDRQDARLVIVRAKVTSDVPIRSDFVATLEPLGITGVNYVQISAGTDSKPLLRDTVPMGVVPMMKSQRDTLSDLLSGGGYIIQRTVETLDRVNRIFSDENIKTLGATLSDVQAVTAELRERKAIVEDAQKTLQNASEAAKQFADLAKSGQGLVNGDARKLLVRLGDAAGEIQGTAKDARAMLDRLQGPTANFASVSLPELGRTIATLQRTLEQFDQLLTEAQSNPRGFVGKPPAKQIEVKP